MDAWRHGHFSAGELADPATAGDDADPDGDGRSNALEFAMGSDPRVDEGPLFDPKARLDRASGEPSIYLEYDKAAAGLRYEVEWAGTLGAASWST